MSDDPPDVPGVPDITPFKVIRKYHYKRTKADLEKVCTELLGAPVRQGNRLLWRCPYHDDKHPSLTIDTNKCMWKCYACDEGGDAVKLAEHELEVGFRAAVRWLFDRGMMRGDGEPSASPAAPAPATGTGPPAPTADGGGSYTLAADDEPDDGKPDRPTQLTAERALGVARYSYGRLHDGSGGSGSVLRYLQGRGLRPETIDRARLGYCDVNAQNRWWPLSSDRGLTIPWVMGRRLRLLAYRDIAHVFSGRPPAAAAGEKIKPPKYFQIYTDDPIVYPRLDAIRPGMPLVICEGELDCLLLDQEIGNLAGVVTPGSATRPPHPAIVEAARSASSVYLAFDSDAAGDGARLRWHEALDGASVPHLFAFPPLGKDWTAYHMLKNYKPMHVWWREMFGGGGRGP
jgi:CHC2 zinc finger/Toprim-like